MSNERITILYDHYKDTCSTIGESVRRRDRLMIFLILALGFFAFQTLFPTTSDAAVKALLDFKFGLSLTLDLGVLGNLVWFLLLVVAIRYFQVATFVERQYKYIHFVEDKLNSEAGSELITREGKSYLGKYPLFSDWMWFLYTIIFPVLLIIVSTAKIIGELYHAHVSQWNFSLTLDVIAFLLLLISTILYLIMLHRKKKG